jgi:tetratricopeptide (TPR) repeat protein
MKTKDFDQQFKEKWLSSSEESTDEAITLVDEGDSLFEQGLYDEGMRLYKQAAELSPLQMDELEFVSRGDILVDQGEYVKAIEFYDQALGINDEEELVWHSKGLALYHMQDLRGAIKCFDRAIRILPAFTEALLARGQSFLALGMYKKAMESIDRAIETNPEEDNAWYYRGIILSAQGELDNAVACYDEALQINPDNIWARHGKAQVLNQIGMFEEASKIHKEIWRRRARILKANPDDPLILTIVGISSIALGNYSAAEKYLLDAIEVDPDSKEALRELGCFYSDHTFEYEKAIEIERRLLRLDPQNYIRKLSLAEDLVGLGDYAKAMKYALEVVPEARRTKDTITECIARFLVLVSHVLKSSKDRRDAALEDFLDYYHKLDAGFTIDENWWIFRGLTNAIINSRASLQARIILVVLLQILQGEIDGQMRHVIQQMIETKES